MADITWGVFKAVLRRTLLQDDEPDEEEHEFKYDDPELRDYLHMALNEFCDHTCVASSVTYTGLLGVEYDLPDNLYTGELLDITGKVGLIGSTGVPTYLDPVYYTDGLSPLNNDAGFWTRPDNKLWLSDTPSTYVTSLKVDYYAYYDLPTADSDLITVPQWARGPLMYLVAAHTIAGYGMKSATIRQWSRRPETGQPEHNPLRKQQEWFMEVYERGIAKFPRQDRINHFRVIGQ